LSSRLRSTGLSPHSATRWLRETESVHRVPPSRPWKPPGHSLGFRLGRTGDGRWTWAPLPRARAGLRRFLTTASSPFAGRPVRPALHQRDQRHRRRDAVPAGSSAPAPVWPASAPETCR
jgi:hypothetical protein